MFALAIISIPLLLAPVFWSLSLEVEKTIYAIDLFIWAAFTTEYLIRLYLAPKRWPFVKSNLIDLAVVALPLLSLDADNDRTACEVTR